MPDSETFNIEPIKGFVQKYLVKSRVSVDPFARNKRWATYTNDLNPSTAAKHHMEAGDFLMILHGDGVKADLVLFDPPYSVRQLSECYDSVGRKCGMEDTQSSTWSVWRNLILPICTPDAVILSFGWNSVGMGKERGFDIDEILLVCHGGMHQDTICMAERRRQDPQLQFVHEKNVFDRKHFLTTLVGSESEAPVCFRNRHRIRLQPQLSILSTRAGNANAARIPDAAAT
jgi:hypothetical protein